MTASLFLFPLVCLLGMVAYEDFRHRGVRWAVFPFLFFLSLGYATCWISWQEWMWQYCFVLAFLASQFLVLTLYLSLKYKKWTWPTPHFLGLGDLLFLLCAGVPLGFPYFLLFHLLSLLLCVLAALFFPSFRRGGVPLAGGQACLLAIVLLFLYARGLSPFGEEWATLLFSLQFL